MARIVFAGAIALVALAGSGGGAIAAEPSSPAAGFTMTLGGKGTLAQAATAAEDTEEACCRRRCCWGGCGGYYGGYSTYYGGAYYDGGFGYGGGYSVGYARPAYYGGYYARPHAVAYGYRGGYGYGVRGGFYVGINGTAEDVAAPAVALNLAAASGGTFRYDGGPASPIPQPKPDASPKAAAAPAAVGLPVSLKKTPSPASPYRYKAYGEK